jgi:hypothetical protein
MYCQHAVMKKISHIINTEHHGCFQNRSQVQSGNKVPHHGKALQEMMSHPNCIILHRHFTQHDATLQRTRNLQCVPALFMSWKFSGRKNLIKSCWKESCLRWIIKSIISETNSTSIIRVDMESVSGMSDFITHLTQPSARNDITVDQHEFNV